MIRIFLIAVMLCMTPCIAMAYEPELIKDELVETTLKDVSVVYPRSNLDYDYQDTAVKTNRTFRAVYYVPLNLSDSLVQEHLKDVSSVYPKAHLVYDYTNIRFIPLKVRFCEKISSGAKQNSEGQTLKLEIVQDVFDGNKKLVSRGSVGHAKLETISPGDLMGVPGEVIISRFEIDGFDSEKFENDIVKSGANLMPLAAALKYSIGTFIPGTGYLFMLIKGGQAKINPDDVFELRYVP